LASWRLGVVASLSYLGVAMTQPPTPNAPLGMADFFALEAGEYLERLDALLAAEGPPAVDEFVRLARALRGSALMASQAGIARAASGLEALARAVREGRRPWDAAIKQIVTRAVDDLKILVRRASNWTEAETAKAEALGTQLEQAAGRASAQIRAAEALGLDAGARAFVAREGAAIASALDRAAQALRANPLAHDPLQHVLRALQPLRGLAALNDLPPLPDLLEGIERAIGELSSRDAKPANPAELFQAAASAIAHAAREVAERGRPDPEGGDFRRFAGLLMQLNESEPDVVPIESLFHADAGPHVVQRGTPAARPTTLGRLELVSHGEHLRQAADSLERAPSPTQRELRAHTLAGTFRALSNVGGGALAEQVAQFALAAREGVTRGIAVNQPAAFAAELRRAGEILVQSASGDETALATQLTALTTTLRALSATGVAPAPAAAPAPAPRVSVPRVPVPHAAPDIVPIESLMAEADPAAEPGLIGSWAVYERLAAGEIGPASLDELLGGGTVVAAAPAVDQRHFTKPFSLESRAPAAEATVVDIRTLLYRGDRALARSRELREQARRVSGDELRAIIDEVCDLVVLAVEPGA
jgi:chemotaxis protein histidine kinase CheA